MSSKPVNCFGSGNAARIAKERKAEIHKGVLSSGKANDAFPQHVRRKPKEGRSLWIPMCTAAAGRRSS